MKKYLKQYWWLILIIVVVIILPVVIVPCSKNDSNVLSYYGGVIGGILAIIGVFFTVKFSQKQYREDQRNSVIPYFSADMLNSHFVMPKVSMNSGHIKISNPPSEISTGYHEEKYTDYYYILKDGKFKITTGLNEQQTVRAHAGGLVLVQIPNGYAMTVKNDVFMPIQLENVGNGAAINFRLGINRSEIKDCDKKYAYSISVNRGEVVNVHLYSEDCDKTSANLGDYDLTFLYQDIFGNKYSQTTRISIVFNEDHNRIAIQMDMYQTQERL